MTMAGARVNGEIDKDKILRRMQNLLNLTYLQAQPMDGGGYRIPEKLFESIQTELDFSPPEEDEKQKIEEQIRKRYRQRNTYRFWKESLDTANIGDHNTAKEFLIRIFSKLDNTRHFGSMTHSRYALETLELALDDTYGTNNVILEQYKFAQPPAPKKKRAKKSKKTTLKVRAKKQSPIALSCSADLVPF
jgi:hypothetical protein